MLYIYLLILLFFILLDASNNQFLGQNCWVDYIFNNLILKQYKHLWFWLSNWFLSLQQKWIYWVILFCFNYLNFNLCYRVIFYPKCSVSCVNTLSLSFLVTLLFCPSIFSCASICRHVCVVLVLLILLPLLLLMVMMLVFFARLYINSCKRRKYHSLKSQFLN